MKLTEEQKQEIKEQIEAMLLEAQGKVDPVLAKELIKRKIEFLESEENE